MIFFIEPWLKKPTWRIVFEREKRIKEVLIPKYALCYPDIEPSIARIDLDEIKKMAAMGSRVASLEVMKIVNSITMEEFKALYKKYAMTTMIIAEEIGHEERIFKRRTIL